MSNMNDNKILELKKQIEEKKAKLLQLGNITYKTNLVLDLDNEKINLNVQNLQKLNWLAIRLNTYRLSALDLKIECIIGGYDINDWLNDIRSKIELISRKEEENKLRQMESKLTKLLSEEKKVELEIDEIAELLK